jgi:hypothetical protein
MEETEMILKTHEMVRYLEEHDFSSQQAEALVDWQAKIIAATGDRLLKSDVSMVKSDLKDVFKEVKRSITTNLIVGQLISALLTVALLLILLL